ncbi:hypothetical protein E1293_15695 [Actinomadura darangshiensis]|uniref:Uncharacterized protein n=1 Tax=Actinomadura darangshiensis TaxID=705336 RepID=A0A4R5BH17_9ACTN|nr:hypothetical protein [Actinomadura darangshiensis]TDD82982.1 hypothetical protein E1293_15695 [Actinomadura darangshiensis]
MDFSSAADELYGVLPAEFVATRKRLAQEAKAAGDAALAKRIGALRRPTLSAWAVNLLSRSAAGDLGDLLDIGDEIRAAWGSGRGLGDLERRRAALVGALVRTTGDLAAEAGNPLREQAVREVEDTLQAATVDAGIAGEVREGRLPQPRSHTGFVPAGFPMAPANGRQREEAPAEEKKKGPPEKEPAKEPERARSNVTRTSAARAKRAETLGRRAGQAERKLAEREERAAEAGREAEEASAEVGRLRRELDRAVAERDAAARRAERAEQNRARAEEAAREARRAAAEARRAADRDADHG